MTETYRRSTILSRASRWSLAITFAMGLSSTPAHAQFRAYVANLQSDNVSVIDTATNTLATTIPVGDSPSGLAVTPDGGACTSPIVDPTRCRSSIPPWMPSFRRSIWARVREEWRLRPTAPLRTVTLPDLDAVSVIETTGNGLVTMVPVPHAPGAIAMTPGGFAYVVHPSNTVSVISTTAHALVTTIAIPAFLQGTDTIAIAPDGALAYVTNRFFYWVYVIDTSRHAWVGMLGPGGGGSSGGGYVATIAVSRDGASLYVPHWYAPRLDIIDRATNRLRSVPLTSRPRGAAITPTGATVYVVGERNLSPTGDDVTVVDTATESVIGRIAVGNYPIAIAIAPRVTPTGPFGGVPQPIPGRMEAEDYDLGGPGVGYSDTTQGNEQGSFVYRRDDVDIKASNEGGRRSAGLPPANGSNTP